MYQFALVSRSGILGWARAPCHVSTLRLPASELADVARGSRAENRSTVRAASLADLARAIAVGRPGAHIATRSPGANRAANALGARSASASSSLKVHRRRPAGSGTPAINARASDATRRLRVTRRRRSSPVPVSRCLRASTSSSIPGSPLAATRTPPDSGGSGPGLPAATCRTGVAFAIGAGTSDPDTCPGAEAGARPSADLRRP
jgi:hypothetical protein